MQQDQEMPSAPMSGEGWCFEWVVIHTLREWDQGPEDRNPRRNDGAAVNVAESMRRFGYGRPLVCWGRGDARRIVVGHTARKAVLHNLQHYPAQCPPNVPDNDPRLVPVFWRDDWSEAEARAYLVTDNKTGELAEWDEALLAPMLQALADDFNLEGLGWNPEDLNDLINPPADTPPAPPASSPEVAGDDEVPEQPAALTAEGDVIQIGRHILHCGSCIDVLRQMPDESVDAIVTDPPYGISFHGEKWDNAVPGGVWAAECLRVLKPGGHIIAFSYTTTYHRMASAMEEAGFEPRDLISWLQWEGFPKSLNIGRALLKAGIPEDVAARWLGWGTLLKPAQEPAALMRKPIAEKTISGNMQEHGTGALHIDACRFSDGDPAWIGTTGEITWTDGAQGWRNDYVGGSSDDLSGEGIYSWEAHPGGRYPANVYYCPKPRASEKGDFNTHKTVKPVRLMRWLVRLVCPDGGIVIDTFAGSGTTMIAAEREGVRCIGMELLPAHCDIIRARLSHAVSGAGGEAAEE